MTKHTLHPNGIFQVEFYNELGLKEAQKYMEQFRTFDFLQSPLKILYDIRKANIKLQLDELSTLTSLAEESTIAYPKVKAAYLVDAPTNTAFSIVFKDLKTSARTTRNIFSTLKAAEEWLLFED